MTQHPWAWGQVLIRTEVGEASQSPQPLWCRHGSFRAGMMEGAVLTLGAPALGTCPKEVTWGGAGTQTHVPQCAHFAVCKGLNCVP